MKKIYLGSLTSWIIGDPKREQKKIKEISEGGHSVHNPMD